MAKVDSIRPIKKHYPLSEKQALQKMVKRSEELMNEFSEFFKSKTLEKLYTPEYHYEGVLPNTTYIMDKKTGKRKLMYISKSTRKKTARKTTEQYKGITPRLEYIGMKKFATTKNRIYPDCMESFANEKYKGTQIRLTQIEVERAMQLGIESIPLNSLPEALPFHAMMGFRPNRTMSRVNSVNDVEILVKFVARGCSAIPKKYFTPIIHEKNKIFYFDENQTCANAIIRFLKDESLRGIERDFKKEIKAREIEMHLSGKELEAWRQRALSQPIILDKKHLQDK